MTDEQPRVDCVRYYTSPQRPTPNAGDRRTTKKHGLQIRVHARARDWNGRPFGFLVRSGRAVYEWRSPQDLEPWDRHFLSEEERQRHFPPEREPGYMQQRGAA